MFKKLLLLFLIVPVLFPRQVFGVSFTIDSINPTSVTSKSDQVTVVLSITGLSSESYFRVAWQEGSKPYFGYMKDDNDNWVKIGTLESDCTVYYKVDANTTSLTLTTKIGEDTDVDNGLYNIKAHRFTSTACSRTDGDNALEIEVNLPTPTPTSTPESTESPTPSPSPTSTSTPKPNTTAVATKKPTSTPEVIGVETTNDDLDELREGLKTDEPEEKEETKKKFPFIAGLFLLGGVGLIGFASFSFIKNKKKEYNNRGEKEGFRKIGFKRDNF